jgi:hypothetical protein
MRDPAVEVLSFQREFATFDEFVFAPTITTTTTTSTTLESAENEIHSVSAEKIYTELTTAEIAALDQPFPWARYPILPRTSLPTTVLLYYTQRPMPK